MITYNDKYKDIYNAYFYDESADDYTAQGIDGHNINYFPDNAVVGDAILFAVERAEAGKFNEIKFNVLTPLVADSITVVWEYSKRGTGYYDPTWHSLSGVVDNTNAFQNSGINSVIFTCPEDWENYFNPGASCRWYAWNIRCRIVSVTNLTEGGKQTAGAITVKPNTIWVSEFTEATPCTLQDIYDADVTGGWGVVSKTGNSYSFNCGLSTNSSTGYFTTKQEVIQFLKNWDCWFYGIIKSGEVVVGSKCKYGSEFIFNLYNGDLKGILAYTNAEIYNTHYRYIFMEGSSVYHGHWGGGLGAKEGQKIYDIYGEGLRQFGFNYDGNVIIGAKGFGLMIESPGAIIKDVTCYGYLYSVRPSSVNIGDYIHECDFSGCTAAPINPYLYSSDNFLMYFIDCNWGTFSDYYQANWNKPGNNCRFFKVNSFLLKILDKNNNAISGANVILKDKNGDGFNYNTSPEGYIGQDYGSISSATAGTMIDTSKNWATNEWWFKEVYITAGAGAGQRRIIKKGNTATELQVAPDWDTIPDTTSKYIIIPYINTAKVEPLTPGTTCYSQVDNLNPFILEIKKAGYKTYKTTFTLDKKIDWKITLAKILDMNISKRVSMFNQ